MDKRRKLTKAERQQIYDKCNGHCAYCGCEITLGQMQVDHVVPIYNGGADEFNNMLPACRPCNHRKGAESLEQFRTSIEKSVDVLNRDGGATYRNAVRFGMIIPNPHHVEFYFESGMVYEQETDLRTKILRSWGKTYSQ